MGNFKKKPIVIEAITFAEFVKYGIENGANIVNDMPWSFNYKKHSVTHESDECYLVPTHQGIVKFTPADMLITQIDGEIYPCKIELFEATYDLVEKESEMTFEEAEKWLEKDLCIALPEWGGFWFHDFHTGKILVLTKDGEVLDTPLDEYKNREDWMIVVPNENQEKIIADYFKSTQTLSFGKAIEALRDGNLVSRKGWNGKGMFVVKQIPGVIGVDIIPRMASLPESVKNIFVERNQPISYESQMLIIKSDGTADSWVPSSSDCFAEDWYIL